METHSVVCPTCFQEFQVPLPALPEVPSEVDYDCEICCRPMILAFEEEEGEVTAFARSIHD